MNAYIEHVLKPFDWADELADKVLAELQGLAFHNQQKLLAVAFRNAHGRGYAECVLQHETQADADDARDAGEPWSY